MDPDAAAVPYDEFLALARDEGLIALDIQVVQAPGDANGRCAVVQATARTAQGSFAAVGEASTLSAPAEWHPFLTTLAEFRAKARALRDLTGLEHTIQEELSAPYHHWHGGYDEMELDSPERSQPPANGAAARAVSTPAARGTAVAATPPARPSARPAPAVGDEDEDDDDIPAGDESPSYSAARTAPPDAQAERDDGHDDGFDAIGRDMEAKLLKMAMSIASLEGSDISESDARQKLDDFFMRAFKHPLSKATRLEGQRVVQRLSSDLARLRTAGSEDKD